MIFSGLFDVLLTLVTYFIKLIPVINIGFNFNFVSILATLFRYANVVMRVDIVLAMWTITKVLDNFQFVTRLFNIIKSFIPFLGS